MSACHGVLQINHYVALVYIGHMNQNGLWLLLLLLSVIIDGADDHRCHHLVSLKIACLFICLCDRVTHVIYNTPLLTCGKQIPITYH